MGQTVFQVPEAIELMEAISTNDISALSALGVASLDEIVEVDLKGSKIAELSAEIGQLTSLQTLDLSETSISVLPHEIGQLTNLQTLDLSGTQISLLPHEIGQLTNLKTLSLRRTQIPLLPHEIGQLTDLQTLDLSGTQISLLPHEIGQLTNLQTLDLSITQICVLPPWIGQLANLQTLNLAHAQISVLPAEIGQLVHLKTLFLLDNPVSSLPPEIGLLTSLNTILLVSVPITALPPQIGQLTSLQTLILFNNSISILPPQIGQLTSLTSLAIFQNPISELPAEIGQLSYLQNLSLSGTQISSLPEDIGQLQQLINLDLDETELVELPQFLCNLPNLEKLSFAKTKIHTIPSWISELKSLRYLSISGLSLKEIPKEVFKLDLPFYISEERYQEKDRSISPETEKGIVMEGTVLKTQPISLFTLDRRFIQAFYDEPKIPVREGKVIFLGDGGAGKSHTIERILKGGADKEISTDQTPGINIKTWEPDCGNKQVRINFWDFGGQEIMHAMHRCFLTGRSLYVVVLRQRSESRHNDLTLQARYWLENIHSFAPDCPVILAINREQGVSGSGGINSRQLREQFSIIVGEPIVYCAKEETDDNFAMLTKAILDQALLLDSTEMEFPRSWNQVRSELEGMSNRKDLQGNKPYIDKSTYQKLCADHGIDDENIRRWLLEWFNDLGVCFSYHQEDGKELDRYQVLNPEWLTNAIYAVIMIGKRPEFSDNGIITCTEINTILQDPTKYAKERTAQFPISYEEDEQGYVLDIMKKFNLCAQLGERNFFIPALCPAETPEVFRPKVGDYPEHTCFEFRYSFLPDSVIHRLMIECIKAGFNRTASYFNGIRVDYVADEIVMTAEADTAKNILSVDVYYNNDPDLARSKLSWVRKKVTEINRAINLKPSSEILVICDGEDRADLRLDYLFALLDEGEHKTCLPAYREGKIVKCDLNVALRLLYNERVIKRAERIRKNPAAPKVKSFQNALTEAEAETEEREQKMKTGKHIEFSIGVSFAGEQRDFIRQVFISLCDKGGFSKEELFFDEWHEHLINGANADYKLDKIYAEHCKKIVVLFSEAYIEKHWTNKLEWTRAITTRITADPENVCLLRHGPVDIDSIDLLHGRKDIVKDVSSMTPDAVADFILRWSERPEL